MDPIRILVVDDSLVIRKLLSATLSSDPEIQVAGTASDGHLALAKIAQLHPDLVTLDVEMPGMNGLEALAALRKDHPKLPVIMFSTLTERGASATLDALALGASDYATKPSNTGSPEVAIAAIRNELLPKIKALCGRVHIRPIPRAVPRFAAAQALRRRVEIVAIGVSTGGPNALAEVLPRIPADFPVPIVLVQHMPPIFTRMLAERLGASSQIAVHEGCDGAALAPGEAWIAPGNFHMTIKRRGMNSRIELNQDPPENSCRPAVDVLFRSVAEAYGPDALAVVMTGMGADGVHGAEQIRQRGGEVLVQDEATSVVWGMPGLVYSAGLADGVYPLTQLGLEITRRARNGSTAQSNHNVRTLASTRSK
ncbi:MAG TPA: chemotaxis response regulator protein-glutamate methylesterase [Candidatus Binatia bacterium]|nr:chemotaxis response regulator protein-glutamate methylesterase [Candidatus Binatia bacterium]